MASMHAYWFSAEVCWKHWCIWLMGVGLRKNLFTGWITNNTSILIRRWNAFARKYIAVQYT